MQQLDMFDQNRDFYFLRELEKMENSYDKRFRAVFGLLTETQNELIDVKKLVRKVLSENNGAST